MIRKRDIDAVLAKVPLFSACSKKELTQIRRHSTTLSFPAGTEVLRQGERGDDFVVIIAGKATVVVDGKPVRSLGPGDFFGEIALLDGGPRTATVTASSDLEAEVIGHREFASLLLEAPTMTRNILKGVAARRHGRPALVGRFGSECDGSASHRRSFRRYDDARVLHSCEEGATPRRGPARLTGISEMVH